MSLSRRLIQSEGNTGNKKNDDDDLMSNIASPALFASSRWFIRKNSANLRNSANISRLRCRLS